jgi:hypothetical protein
MRCLVLVVMSVILLLGSQNIIAQEATQEEKILGAVVGGVIGSQVGSGSGRDAATIAGALIGYNWAENRTHGRREFVRYCRRNIPVEYYDVKKSWIEGCVARLERERIKREKQAYRDGLNNGSTN